VQLTFTGNATNNNNRMDTFSGSRAGGSALAVDFDLSGGAAPSAAPVKYKSAMLFQCAPVKGKKESTPHPPICFSTQFSEILTAAFP
jgi:hypothetical protein